MRGPSFVPQSRSEAIETLIRMGLSEDVGAGDRTTEWTVPAKATGTAGIFAKASLVVAGIEPACRVFQTVDPQLDLDVFVRDGGSAEPGERVMEVSGRVTSILQAERTALNFLGRLSGIATLTRAFAEELSGTDATVIDTRKTTPGWRVLEKDAVRSGGGRNHRMGLHDMVLIKENHIAAAGGIAAALSAVAGSNRSGLPVEIEVGSLEEFGEALVFGPDRIMLDNMSLGDMREAVRIARVLGSSRPDLEASGNVTLQTVRKIGQTGVDLISVGALTHSAPVADLSLRLDP